MNLAGIAICTLVAGIGFLAFYGFLSISLSILDGAPYQGPLRLRSGSAGPLNVATFAALAAGKILTTLVGEILVRGILYNGLKAFSNWLWAACFTSLIHVVFIPFAIAKFDPPHVPHGFWIGVALALFGTNFGLCWLNERFGGGSILPSWLTLTLFTLLGKIFVVS